MSDRDHKFKYYNLYSCINFLFLSATGQNIDVAVSCLIELIMRRMDAIISGEITLSGNTERNNMPPPMGGKNGDTFTLDNKEDNSDKNTSSSLCNCF